MVNWYVFHLFSGYADSLALHYITSPYFFCSPGISFRNIRRILLRTSRNLGGSFYKSNTEFAHLTLRIKLLFTRVETTAVRKYYIHVYKKMWGNSLNNHGSEWHFGLFIQKSNIFAYYFLTGFALRNKFVNTFSSFTYLAPTSNTPCTH